LTISIPETPPFDAIGAFVGSTLTLLKLCLQIEAECTYDVGALAIMGILNQCADTINGRFSIQAAMLALHLTSTSEGKQARTLLLLSIRLHMALGLATIAFSQYPDVHVKEFLNDTVSYILLSRISQIHPFDTNGAQRTLPGDALAKVADTIGRMEARTGAFIYTDMKNFLYDQAIELLEFKHKLRSSLTRHLCLLERRRIARLKLEAVDEALVPPKDGKLFSICEAVICLTVLAFDKIADNRDFDVFPNFEASDRSNVNMLWGNETRSGCPTTGWYLEQWRRDEAVRYINNETSAPINIDVYSKQEYPGDAAYPDSTASELELHEVWACTIEIVSYLRQTPKGWDPDSTLQSLRAKLEDIHKSVLETQQPDYESSRKEDAQLGLSEDTFTWAYGRLEVLQVLTKLCDRLDEQAKKKDSPLQAKLKANTVKGIREIIDSIYNEIRSIVKRRIDFLKKVGKQCIVAQVRWGATGEALKQLISDAQLERYATQYVASALDANEGILKVKLKK
jgi:N-terminal acetyltransferase B complex non-catalytic subunit